MNKLVLVLNCGSSSIKFSVVDPTTAEEYLTGLAECFYLDDARIKWKIDGEKHKAVLGAGCAHDGALTFIVETILASKPKLSARIAAIGHRIVHGGEEFTQSVVVNNDVTQSISDCSSLAPLHNPAHVVGIEAAQKAFPDLKNVAVFDTAFHQSMPEEAFLYALPYKFYRDHSVRRYGMHGSSHYYVSRKAAEQLNIPIDELNIISCHLGNGASVCAIKGGKSVDTSMGLTPLEGLVMGTRCGDIDPAIIFHLHDQLDYSLDEINNILTKESGLLGLTEVTSDCRYTEDNYGKKEEATRAMDVFTHRLAKYIAGYTACLDGRLDAVVFTGGIGENAAPIREFTLDRLKIFGFDVDQAENRKACFGTEGIITKKGSPISMVINTNEELVIAQDTARLLF